MFDDLDRLRNDLRLRELFFTYARLAAPNHETWQARRMQMDGVNGSELSKLHGELIALDWIEQNTGQSPCRYRLTPAGIEALRQIENPEDGQERLTWSEFENRAA